MWTNDEMCIGSLQYKNICVEVFLFMTMYKTSVNYNLFLYKLISPQLYSDFCRVIGDNIQWTICYLFGGKNSSSFCVNTKVAMVS